MTHGRCAHPACTSASVVAFVLLRNGHAYTARAEDTLWRACADEAHQKRVVSAIEGLRDESKGMLLAGNEKASWEIERVDVTRAPRVQISETHKNGCRRLVDDAASCTCEVLPS